MATLTRTRTGFLEETFGERANFDRTERKLYSHDVGELPRLIKPIVGDTVPEAIVQPQDEAEIVALVNWARENRVPLTPRGKATSGYGGVIPIKGGAVVDFFRMDRVLSVDTNAGTVTVQPGAVWERVDKTLGRQGLTLRLYPTSYMASTVGGWLAHGGAGIGSFEAGWFIDNVVSARVVLPTGDAVDYSGAELDLVSEAMGTTGIISQVTLRVMPLAEMQVTTFSVATAEGLQAAGQAMVELDLPIWSVLFINPKMAELKNQAPLRMHLGHPAEEKVKLPAAYIVTVTYRATDKTAVLPAVEKIVRQIGGAMLSEHVARHEWDNRFKVMLVKRLGPSLVPAEVVIPLESLAAATGEIERKITQPIVKEGILVRKGRGGKPEVVILGFIPGDQRKFSYNFVFGLSLSITGIAEKHGGRAYATGLYFTGKASQVLGPDRLRRLREAKRLTDPKRFMNPGKVIDRTAVSRAITLAGAFEPMARMFGNRVRTEIGERPKMTGKDIAADVAWYAYSCSQCGYCVSECDQFYGRGWESQSPRGKWYFLRELMEGREKWTQKMVDTFLVCTTCELCNLRCSESLPIEPSWMKLRGKLIEEQKRMTFPPFEMMAAALQAEGGIWAGYRRDRTNWFPEDLKEKHGPGKKGKVAYFAGCTASYVEQDIAIGTTRLLDAAGVDFVALGNQENCCGTPMLVAGKWEIFAENMKHNIQVVKDAGADTVVSSCPACDMMWRQVYPEWAAKLGIEYDITAKHYSEVVSEKIKDGTFTFPKNGEQKTRVTWHDSCHAGRVSGIYDPPRDLIKAMPHVEFVEMASHHEEAKCCGSVLTLIKEPKVAAEIGKDRLDEAVDAGAQTVLAMCPCCQFQLRVSAEKKEIPVAVEDLSSFAAKALGFDLPDPHPEVRAQWAVFEAMIDLMTPKGFAELMGTMWPQLIDAMPLGMGPMMRLMGKIPLTLEMMKPIFPVLFPILLPKMMPKVMPTMLARVADRVPMPDYMREQMPDLMPQVMDNLMPHMIGEVVGLVTQPMIDYLRGRTAAKA